MGIILIIASKDYAEITIPLRKILHSKGPFNISEEHRAAITKLKRVLMSEPLLAHPDWDLPFRVHCDASNYAIGVVLCQVIDGRERVVGYYSRLLRDAEKYDVTQECLFQWFGLLRSYDRTSCMADLLLSRRTMRH